MTSLEHIKFGNDKVTLSIAHAPDIPPYIEYLRHADGTYSDITTFQNPQSIVQLEMDGLMQENFGSRYSETYVGNDLRYASHEIVTDHDKSTLNVHMRSEHYGLEVTATFTAPSQAAAIQASVTVKNAGDEAHTLTAVSTWSAYVNLGKNNPDSWELYTAVSDWTAENRWRHENIRDYELVKLLNVDSSSLTQGTLSATITPAGATMTRSSSTSRSTGSIEPAGGLVDRETNDAVFWQIENNGPWLYQVGERVDGVYLDLYGPTDIEHHWSVDLNPGDSWSTVTGTIAVSAQGFDGAVDEMTQFRRFSVRKHPDHEHLPVIFNDYMNTLMGDPTTEREIPLIDSAAKAGAEYYCIDCGWYDDSGDWWPSVGEWNESKTRFPNGLVELLDHIRDKGMKPGIWLEPEAIGVNSPMAQKLPEAAFLQRNGQRLKTHMRYMLDLRNDAAVDHLNAVVDRLVGTLGIRFFKFDYNVNTGAGTSYDAPSRGEGQLETSKAYLKWVDSLLDRYPELTIETCSSGAMRSDWATLSHSQLQSTSDQQDYLQYANIAAAAPLMMLPEQCGNWAYPNETMTLAETEYTMLCGMVGRLYLSGYLTKMPVDQFALVSKGLDVYKSIRKTISTSVPFWPTDVPQWRDNIVTFGLKAADGSGLLAVWNKNHDSQAFSLQLQGANANFSSVEEIFGGKATSTWDAKQQRLTITPTQATGPFAALFAVRY